MQMRCRKREYGSANSGALAGAVNRFWTVLSEQLRLLL
jgi:hypothetical protein